jgi:predicted  nucleic acid-binding Zn-ribbon protein
LDSSVETSISQLAALQQIDRQLREKTERVHALEGELADLESQLLLQREATRSAQAERDATDQRLSELEAMLDAEEGKMKDRRMRLNRVRNEKELQALRREIELGKEANQQIEEELLRVLESLESQVAAAAEAERVLTELEAASAAKIVERGARITELMAEAASQREGRDRLAATLDASLRQKYEQIFERRGGTAVVEVRNGTCQGCHMQLPPQFANELQRSREVRLCPNCHRILFWRPEPVEPVDSTR